MQDWKEFIIEKAIGRTNKKIFYHEKTKLRVRFDLKKEGAPGFEGKDHWHVYNPNTRSKKDLYFDKDGNVVRDLHILYQKKTRRIKLTVTEFEEKYYLHDSTIDKIEYDAENKKLTLTIDFCFWMQLWYEQGKPENGYIAVTFENVSFFEYEQHEFSNILENLDTEIDHIEIATDGMLEIYIWEYNSPTEKDNFWWIKIRAENITVEEL